MSNTTFKRKNLDPHRQEKSIKNQIENPLNYFSSSRVKQLPNTTRIPQNSDNSDQQTETNVSYIPQHTLSSPPQPLSNIPTRIQQKTVRKYQDKSSQKYRPKLKRGKKSNQHQLTKQSQIQQKQTQKVIRDYQPIKILPKKPQLKSISSLIGNKSQISKLNWWLSNWSTQQKKHKAVLISGPPGVGKSTAAKLVSESNLYTPIHFNASDSRNKKILQSKIRPLCLNTSIKSFKQTTKSLLIMDQVDGMSGGDQGGLQALSEIIKITKIPIICICNQRQNKHLKKIANGCLDLRFYPPSVNQIILFLQQIDSDMKPRFKQLAELSRGDIRQLLILLNSITIEPSIDLTCLQKDTLSQCNPFEAANKLFRNKKLSVQQKVNLVLSDDWLVPELLFENYTDTLNSQVFACNWTEFMSLSDIVHSRILSSQDYSLFPQYAYLAQAGTIYSKNQLEKINFPQAVGQAQIIKKNQRLRLEFLEIVKPIVQSSQEVELYVDLILMQMSQMVLNDQRDEFSSFLETYRMTKQCVEEYLLPLSSGQIRAQYPKKQANKFFKRLKQIK